MITERLASSDELMTSILLNDPQVLCVDEEDNLFIASGSNKNIPESTLGKNYHESRNAIHDAGLTMLSYEEPEALGLEGVKHGTWLESGENPKAAVWAKYTKEGLKSGRTKATASHPTVGAQCALRLPLSADLAEEWRQVQLPMPLPVGETVASHYKRLNNKPKGAVGSLARKVALAAAVVASFGLGAAYTNRDDIINGLHGSGIEDRIRGRLEGVLGSNEAEVHSVPEENPYEELVEAGQLVSNDELPSEEELARDEMSQIMENPLFVSMKSQFEALSSHDRRGFSWEEVIADESIDWDNALERISYLEEPKLLWVNDDSQLVVMDGGVNLPEHTMGKSYSICRNEAHTQGLALMSANEYYRLFINYAIGKRNDYLWHPEVDEMIMTWIESANSSHAPLRADNIYSISNFPSQPDRIFAQHQNVRPDTGARRVVRMQLGMPIVDKHSPSFVKFRSQFLQLDEFYTNGWTWDEVYRAIPNKEDFLRKAALLERAQIIMVGFGDYLILADGGAEVPKSTRGRDYITSLKDAEALGLSVLDEWEYMWLKDIAGVDNIQNGIATGRLTFETNKGGYDNLTTTWLSEFDHMNGDVSLTEAMLGGRNGGCCFLGGKGLETTNPLRGARRVLRVKLTDDSF